MAIFHRSPEGNTKLDLDSKQDLVAQVVEAEWDMERRLFEEALGQRPGPPGAAAAPPRRRAAAPTMRGSVSRPGAFAHR